MQGQITKSQETDWVSKLKVKTSELRETGQDIEENPTIELGLLMDCTSSMSSWIVKAKETLVEIINKIVEECNSEGNLKVRVSFIGYRDISDNRFSVMPFTEDIQAVKSFIQKVGAEGGADAPEDLQGGLQVCLHQDWTEEAAKRVFMIMDAPCHGKKYHSCSDDYPNGSPEGLVLEDLIKEFCKKEIEFTVIKLDNNCDKMISVMKECHQELEVQDMTTMKPSYSSFSSRAMPAYEESATYAYADLGASYGCAEEGASYAYAEESASYGCAMAMPAYDGSALFDDLASLDCAKYEAKDLGSEMKMDMAECNDELDECAGESTKSKGLFSSLFGGSKKSKAKAAPEKMMMKKSRAAPMMSEAPMMSMKNDMAMSRGPMKKMRAAPADFEMEQQMAYQSKAITDVTSQFKRKQAAHKSKKMSMI